MKGIKFMKRKECFFGLHFDFHANAETKDIGKNLDEAVLERIITEVQPDFVQCDTKGHPGYASYESNIGNSSPHLSKSLLHVWRKATVKHGVLLFSHYSGIWDKLQAQLHPEWCAVDKDGRPTDKMSVFGDYAEKLLIPQLKEIASLCVDGAWVDGECWAQALDYGSTARRLFCDKYRLNAYALDKDTMPLWLDFQRKAFFDYVQNYIDEVHKVYPNFELTSNWMNTAWVPNNIAFTDYISGDLSPTNSVDSARFDGRIIQSFGRNWDLMSWGISYPVHHVKGAVQLMQEAAAVISLGGGFQIYNMQSPQNTIMDEWAISSWAEVSRFVRERKQFCRGAKVLPDVGIVYSVKGYYNNLSESLFFRDNAYNMELYGVLLSLCDSGRSVSAVNSERIAETDLSEYKLLVVTNTAVLEEGLAETLREYVQNGGKLLVIGADSSVLLAKTFGLSAEKISEHPVVMAQSGNSRTELRCDYAEISGGQTLLTMQKCSVEGDIKCSNPPPTIVPNEQIPLCEKVSFGNGAAYFVPLNYGKLYLNERTFELSNIVHDIVSETGCGMVSVNKPAQVDVNLMQKDGKKYVHVVNLLGEHRSQDVKTFNNIPPVLNVEVRCNFAQNAKSVKLQPQNVELTFTQTENGIAFTLDKVDIYSVVEIEE